MSRTVPNCGKCGGAMEVGFTLDRAHANRATVSTWIEGYPDPSFWSGLKLSGRANRPCVTFRCAACGFLESYALAPERG